MNRTYYIYLHILIIFAFGFINFASGADFHMLSNETVTVDRTALILLVTFVFLALSISFLCSVAEAVLLSITPAYIESQKLQNPKLAENLKKLRLENIDNSLAAILTMNTIAHTVGAIEAGAQASILFGSNWVGLFSAIITLMILILSEIIPKTLGAVYWTQLVGLTQLYIRSLIILLYPLVLISNYITRLIAGGKNIHSFSREELIALAGVGKKSGHIDQNEFKIIYNLLRLKVIQVSDIMTPRTVIESLNEKDSITEIQKKVAQSPFSRFPLLGEGIDDIKGFVLKDDILTHSNNSISDLTLKSLKREIQIIPKTTLLPKLLHFFLHHRIHIAIVVDEFGGTQGVVTLEDVLETLLGMEIVDELDNAEDMQIIARKQWYKRIKQLGLELNDEIINPQK